MNISSIFLIVNDEATLEALVNACMFGFTYILLVFIFHWLVYFRFKQKTIVIQSTESCWLMFKCCIWTVSPVIQVKWISGAANKPFDQNKSNKPSNVNGYEEIKHSLDGKWRMLLEYLLCSNDWSASHSLDYIKDFQKKKNIHNNKIPRGNGFK